MSYFAIAGAAISAVGMVGSSQSAGYAADAAVATTKGQLEVQKANTKLSNANGGLANHMRALNNNRQLKQYGKAQAALQSNQDNQRDASTANKFETGLRQAEARGALAANMAFSGSAGASFDAIESSARLRDQRMNQQTKDFDKQLDYNAAQERVGLTDNMLNALDQSVNSGTVDTSVYTPQVTGGTNWAQAIGPMVSSAGQFFKSSSSAGSGGSYPTGGLKPGSSLSGLKTTTGGAGLSSMSGSTSFFNLGNSGSSLYSLY